MSPVKPESSPQKSNGECPYLTNKIQHHPQLTAVRNSSHKHQQYNKSPFLNRSNVLSDITEIPELKFHLEQANRVEKEFEKLVMDGRRFG